MIFFEFHIKFLSEFSFLFNWYILITDAQVVKGQCDMAQVNLPHGKLSCCLGELPQSPTDYVKIRPVETVTLRLGGRDS